MFLRRGDSTESYKELEEQIDNKFTLLEVLETSHVISTSYTKNFIFTLSKSLDVLKCWSVRSGKLQNSVRIERVPKSDDNCDIYANDKLLILVIVGNASSQIWSWNYKAKDARYLKREITHHFSIEHFILRNDNFVCTKKNDVYVYCIEEDKHITQTIILKEDVSFLDLSDRGYLYIANGQNLSAIDIRESFKKVTNDSMDKILALFEVKMDSMSLVITCHRNHIVRIWKWNLLGILAEVNLLQPELKPNYRLGGAGIVYNVHYIPEREELVISHNDNITIVDIKSRKHLHVEMHAHRSEISAISAYKGEPSYIMTKSDSEVRLWRYGQNSEHGLLLVGEITVSNVDELITVDNVGLYMSGKCYDAGLVLWRDANSYLTDRMKASRQFFNEAQ